MSVCSSWPPPCFGRMMPPKRTAALNLLKTNNQTTSIFTFSSLLIVAAAGIGARKASQRGSWQQLALEPSSIGRKSYQIHKSLLISFN